MSDVLKLSISGGTELVLAPSIGGSIARFIWQGAPVLRGADDPNSPLDCGCFPLVPYCNRIRDGRFTFRDRTIEIALNMLGDASPLHGDGWLGAWEVEHQSDSQAELSFRYPGGEWPWPYAARQTFGLSEDGLSAEIGCTNLSDEPMPCGLGFHPYFPCDAATRIDTKVGIVWPVDEKVLPLEPVAPEGRYALADQPACARGLDNGYGGWGGEMRLIYGDGHVTTMGSPDARFFQIYSPPSGGLLAAEPVSHANAALNAPEEDWPELGMCVLEPGETMRLRMHLSLKRHTGSARS